MSALMFFSDMLETILYFFVDIFNWLQGFEVTIGDFVLNGFTLFGSVFFTLLVGIWVAKIVI